MIRFKNVGQKRAWAILLGAIAVGSSGCALTPGVSAGASPYAGQQTRLIKALSSREQQDILEGKGMGLAKAAELNGYPGPMHTLEHAGALNLSAEQLLKTKALLHLHKQQVRALGAQLVEAEKTLDESFASKRMSAELLKAQLMQIGRLQVAIREEHLRTHLVQTSLLTPEQIERYKSLQGYL